MIEGLLRPSHLLLILVVALFVFGPKKLPELGKGLAQGIRGFKDAINFSEEPTASEEKSFRSRHETEATKFINPFINRT